MLFQSYGILYYWRPTHNQMKETIVAKGLRFMYMFYPQYKKFKKNEYAVLYLIPSSRVYVFRLYSFQNNGYALEEASAFWYGLLNI